MLAMQGFVNAAIFAVLGIFGLFFMFGLWLLAALFAGAAAVSIVAPLVGRVAMIGIWSLLAFATFPTVLNIPTSGLSFYHLVPAYVAAGLIGAFVLPAGPMPPVEGTPP